MAICRPTAADPELPHDGKSVRISQREVEAIGVVQEGDEGGSVNVTISPFGHKRFHPQIGWSEGCLSPRNPRTSSKGPFLEEEAPPGRRAERIPPPKCPKIAPPFGQRVLEFIEANLCSNHVITIG